MEDEVLYLRKGEKEVEIIDVIIPIEPMGAVRENRNSKWGSGAAAKRVNKYHDWKKSVQVLWLQAMLKMGYPANTIPKGEIISFEFGMSILNPEGKSVSKKEKQKRLDMVGEYHTKKPDWDNLCKAFIDALYYGKDIDDCTIYKVGSVEKRYAHYGEGYIRIIFAIKK